MKRVRCGYFFASLAIALWMVLFTGLSFAAEEAKAPEPAKVEAPAAAPAAPAAAEPAPKLPSYFTATSDDPKKPSAWPDPTGAASGVWATPAGDAKGDVPDQLKPADLYDRIAHNLYSINYVWALIAGFLVMFMQKCCAHCGDELDDLSARLPCVLGVRLRDWLGELVEWARTPGMVPISRSRPVGAQ